MEIKTSKGIAKPFPLSDIQENNKWLKVLAVSFAVFVFFLIAFALWLKFSGIGHNIIYELSPKNPNRDYVNTLIRDVDYWNDMWAECEFGDKNYNYVRSEYGKLLLVNN